MPYEMVYILAHPRRWTLHRASSVAVFCCVRKILNTEDFTEIVNSVCLILISVLVGCITRPLSSLFWFFVIVVGVCGCFEIVSLCNQGWTESHGSPLALAS